MITSGIIVAIVLSVVVLALIKTALPMSEGMTYTFEGDIFTSYKWGVAFFRLILAIGVLATCQEHFMGIANWIDATVDLSAADWTPVLKNMGFMLMWYYVGIAIDIAVGFMIVMPMASRTLDNSRNSPW